MFKVHSFEPIASFQVRLAGSESAEKSDLNSYQINSTEPSDEVDLINDSINYVITSTKLPITRNLTNISCLTSSSRAPQIWIVQFNEAIAYGQITLYMPATLMSDRLKVNVLTDSNTHLNCMQSTLNTSVKRPSNELLIANFIAQSNDELSDNVNVNYGESLITGQQQLFSSISFRCQVPDDYYYNINLINLSHPIEHRLPNRLLIQVTGSVSEAVSICGLTVQQSSYFKCGHPPLPLNGYISSSESLPVAITTGDKSSRFVSAQKVAFSCGDGFTLDMRNDSVYYQVHGGLLCDAQGKWTEQVPVCRNHSQVDHGHKVTEDTNYLLFKLSGLVNYEIISFVTIVLVLLLICFLAACGMCLRKRSCTKEYFVERSESMAWLRGSDESDHLGRRSSRTRDSKPLFEGTYVKAKRADTSLFGEIKLMGNGCDTFDERDEEEAHML